MITRSTSRHPSLGSTWHHRSVPQDIRVPCGRTRTHHPSGPVCEAQAIAEKFGKATGTLFPAFRVHDETVYMQLACAALVAVVAALVPCWRASQIRIVDGLRNIG